MQRIALVVASVMVLNVTAIGVLSTFSLALPVLTEADNCESLPLDCQHLAMDTLVQDAYRQKRFSS